MADQKGETIVVFVDGSDLADKAFEKAVQWKKKDDTLYVVHIPKDMSGAMKGIIVMQTLDTTLFNEINSDIVEHSKSLIAKYVKKCAELAVSNMHGVSLGISNDPTEEAVQFLQEHKATVVFVGSRGLGAMKKFFMGSFSDYVLKNAGCSVMVVKDAALSA